MQITQSLHRAVQAVPQRVCTIFGERRRTYGDVADRVARFAGALRAQGVRDGDRVAMYALNSDNYYEFLLSVPWAAGVVVPVNIRWSTAEVAFSLVDSGVSVVLIDDAFLPRAEELRAAVDHEVVFVYCGEHTAPEGMLDYEEMIRTAEPIADARRQGTDLYGIYYTGGTTGRSKGVMLDHRALLSSAVGSAISGDMISRGGRLLHAAPMFHLADGAAGNAANLRLGTHVIVPSFTPAGVAAAIEEHRVTDVLLVPTMVHMLLDSPEGQKADLSSLKRLIYGASPMSETVLKRAMERFGKAGFVQAYGMTELAPVASTLTPDDHLDPALVRSCGRPAAHCEMRIVDADDAPLPPGEIGEIVVRGDNVMQGYWNLPEQSAAALRGGWMHTGDLGFMDSDGYFFVVDRLKDMIITGGENVYSIEVENVLADHPKVVQAAVVGAPDPEWGERVHACLVLRPGEATSLEEIQDFCKASIANFKMPRSIEIVTEFPVSGAGKILKRDLREELWSASDRAVN